MPATPSPLRLRAVFVLPLLLSFAFSALSPQAASSELSLAKTTANLRLREEPTSQSRIITVMPTGSLLNVVRRDSIWCQVQFGDFSGYAAERYLSQISSTIGTALSDQSVPAQPLLQRVYLTGDGYINSRGHYVRSPAYTSDGRPPSGATAQCCDGTFSFSQSRRGTCSHHGGVCRWLP